MIGQAENSLGGSFPGWMSSGGTGFKSLSGVQDKKKSYCHIYEEKEENIDIINVA